MTSSNAERQHAYRDRHLKDGELERLDTLIDMHAKHRLERLASCYGLTQREMLERLLLEAESSLFERLSSDEQDAYYDQRLQLE